MENSMKEKINLIIIDKGITAIVVAIVVALVTFMMNVSLENKKSENNIKSGIVKDFINECETDWGKITEIEITSENLISDIRFAYLTHDYVGDIYSNKSISEKIKNLNKMRDDAYSDIRKKESLLTKNIVINFGQYIGLQKMVFDGEMGLELQLNTKMESNTSAFIKESKEQLGKMRFGINQAKNMAIMLYMQ
jgi:hypothetical protein